MLAGRAEIRHTYPWASQGSPRAGLTAGKAWPVHGSCAPFLAAPGGNGRAARHTRKVALSANERRILGLLGEKDTLDVPDCARLASVGEGVADASLRSLARRGFATANEVRKGFGRKPDGTYSITPAGRDAATAA